MTTEETIQMVTDFQHAFTGAHGARVYKSLSNYCMEHSSTFRKESARVSDFNEGARSVILEIRHWLDMDINKL